MKRSFPPRFYRERRETYLHYRFLRKRGRFLARSGEDGRPESVWIARERGKRRGWLGVTSTLFPIGPKSKNARLHRKNPNQRDSLALIARWCAPVPFMHSVRDDDKAGEYTESSGRCIRMEAA